MLHDVFICHASDDKDDFVRPLAEALRACHIEVWFDEFSLSVGDSLRQAIDRGLANSRFGIVVLSPAFFRKRWPQRELNGLVAREMNEGRELVLPIWHGVDHAEIVKHSPPLADVHATNSAKGMSRVVAELLKKLRPEESPLIIARDFLISKGMTPPIVTDEWWLDVVEFKESQLRFPDLNVGHRWIFPLPYGAPDYGKERGLNIAWTALQMQWKEEGEERKYCQLTHPERLHRYVRQWPGLFECCRLNPSILALYAPQLTMPGLDDGFSDLFDELLKRSYVDSLNFFHYGEPSTIDGKQPLCGEEIAWRHPTCGNYTDAELASSFVNAHTGDYSRRVHGGFTCLMWLLTDAATWLPERIRSRLINGLRTRTYPWSSDISSRPGDDAFYDALWRKDRSKFRFSRTVLNGLEELIRSSLHELGIEESSALITQRFVSADFVEGYFDERERHRRGREA